MIEHFYPLRDHYRLRALVTKIEHRDHDIHQQSVVLGLHTFSLPVVAAFRYRAEVGGLRVGGFTPRVSWRLLFPILGWPLLMLLRSIDVERGKMYDCILPGGRLSLRTRAPSNLDECHRIVLEKAKEKGKSSPYFYFGRWSSTIRAS